MAGEQLRSGDDFLCDDCRKLGGLLLGGTPRINRGRRVQRPTNRGLLILPPAKSGRAPRAQPPNDALVWNRGLARFDLLPAPIELRNLV